MNQTCPHEKAERVELAIPKVIINFWDCSFYMYFYFNILDT